MLAELSSMSSRLVSTGATVMVWDAAAAIGASSSTLTVRVLVDVVTPSLTFTPRAMLRTSSLVVSGWSTGPDSLTV